MVLRSSVFYLLLYGTARVVCTPRVPAVQRILDVHSDLLQQVCDSMLHEFGKEWLCTQVPIPSARSAKYSVPARDTTLIDSSLDMIDAMQKMLHLSFPRVPGQVDPVLEGVIGRVSYHSAAIVYCGSALTRIRYAEAISSVPSRRRSSSSPP